jgi:predicted permease
MMQDVKVAIRRLIKEPAFSASAAIVLALGIGVNTAVFDIAHTLLFSTPPFSNPSELVQVFSQDKTNSKAYRAFSYPTYRDIRDDGSAFTDVMGFDLFMIGVGQKGDTRRTFASTVSSNYFSVLGVPLARGRSFTADEETPGRQARVAIVSYAYWQKRDLDPAVVGSEVLIDGRPFTIVGVAPRGFTGTTRAFSIEVWTPLGVYDELANDSGSVSDRLGDRAGQQLKVIGRLKPGLSAIGARPRLEALAARLEKAFPVEQKDQTFIAAPVPRLSVNIEPPREDGLSRLGLLLLGVSGVVLLVACLNLANLLLARGVARRKEVAIRLAIGASRARIVRQLMVEGFVLATIGGVAGLVLGVWSAGLLMTSMPAVLPVQIFWPDGPSIPILLATLGFCMAATLGFALGPALKVSRSAGAADLKQQTGDAMGRRRGWLAAGNPLVVLQIAISLGLLTAGALFMHGATKAATVDSGLHAGASVLVETDASLAGLKPTAAQQLYWTLRDRLAAQPGVDRAAISAIVPFGLVSSTRAVQRAGVRPAAGSLPKTAADGLAFPAAWNSVSAEYFETVGLPILRGRAFNAAEAIGPANGRTIAIVDEVLAKRLWPDEDALGRFIEYAAEDAPRAEGEGGGGIGYSDDGNRPPVREPIQIVGIVPAARRGLFEKKPTGQMYVPFAHGFQSNIFYFVRFRSLERRNEAAAAAAIRQTVREVDPALPVLSLQTFDAHLGGNLQIWFVRAGAAMFSTFGGLALILAAAGLYGIRAYAVSRRTREIGIRMALGAEGRDISRMLVRESALTIGGGIALGLLLAVAIGKALSGLLYEIGPLDPISFVSASLILGTSALIATWLPARRATRVAPTVALRTE